MTQMQSRGRLQFLLLAALFFAPLLAAVLFYFVFPDWQPDAHTNYGELVVPARPLPDAPLRDADGATVPVEQMRGRWSYVYVGGTTCGAACADKLHQIRQIRTLLNEKRLRVQRVYLAPDVGALGAAAAQLSADHPDLKFYADTETSTYGQFFGGSDTGALYLVDPLGNWLMIYAADADSKGILKDIKKLLRVSQIG
jgi:cytochrome oxidase Cu insertion factor (SCO1/SenC/PrrC family)